LLSSLLKAADGEEKITILKSTELARLSGDPGFFAAALRSDGRQHEENFGAVIVSTGGKEYVPDGLLHGKDKRVITQLELGQILDAGELQAASVVMIQCAGSRDIDWPVCARTCCAQALTNALRLKETKPETRITILHRDIRVYYLEEELFSQAKEKGIEFVALNESAALMPLSSRVTVDAGEGLSVSFARRGSSARESISTDYLILSTGFRPNSATSQLAGILGVEIDNKGFFTERHPALGSVESSRKGIYVCGLAHSPRSVSETIAQAMAAAEKASSFLRGSGT